MKLREVFETGVKKTKDVIVLIGHRGHLNDLPIDPFDMLAAGVPFEKHLIGEPDRPMAFRGWRCCDSGHFSLSAAPYTTPSSRNTSTSDGSVQSQSIRN